MKIICIALLLTSMSATADEYGYGYRSNTDPVIANRINQLQQQMDYNSTLNQGLRAQNESNNIARERLDYERSRNDEMDFRRAIGAN